MKSAKTHPFLRVQRSGLLRLELGRTFRLALPLMLGELSSILMGMAGTIMIGHLGETELAAFGIANVVFVTSMLLIWGSIRMIPTPVAEAHELRDGRRVRTLLFAGLLLGVFFILIACGLLWLGISCFHWLKQDPEVSVLAMGYLKIIVFSMPALVYLALLVNYADAFEYVRFTMWISFAGLALDVFLNWVFVFGKFGFAPMGINAIAMNTGITHFLMTLSLVWLIGRRKALQYFRESRTHWAAVWAQTREFIRLGVPSALQVMVEFAAFGAGTIIIGQISKTEQAAHQIAINLVSVTYVTIMGVSTGGMIRVGQALAYKNRAKIWMAGVATIVLSVLIMAVPTICFLLFPGQIVSFYIQDPAVAGIAATLLFFAGLFQMADATQLASLSLLRSLNDVKLPSFFSFLAFWVVGLPLGYWLAVYEGWNARGIWMGYLVALVIQAALFLRRFFVLVERLK
ncbi:MAG: MATE family efflux transporter [Saprospiraceae bacterium]|nr:MATE family efflux transporter [Saprospiraceae bacterium]